MFGIKAKAAPSSPEAAPISVSTSEIAVEQPSQDKLVALGSAAMSELRGFSASKSGLLVPDGSAKVELTNSGETLITDSRRVTLETVEANFTAEQERLASPLEREDLQRATETILAQMKQREASYRGDDQLLKHDMQRDPAALHRLTNVLNGERDLYVAHATREGERLTPSEQLGRVVDQYAQLVPERFGPDSIIGSMGGTVNIPENGVIHCEGYNGSILYDFARAKQIIDTLEADPKAVRETILEAADPDASWVLERPVVVTRPTQELQTA